MYVYLIMHDSVKQYLQPALICKNFLWDISPVGITAMIDIKSRVVYI